jgi:hypothetical protein
MSVDSCSLKYVSGHLSTPATASDDYHAIAAFFRMSRLLCPMGSVRGGERSFASTLGVAGLRRFPTFGWSWHELGGLQHRCFWNKATSGRRQIPPNLVELNPIYVLVHCLPGGHQVTDGVV